MKLISTIDNFYRKVNLLIHQLKNSSIVKLKKKHRKSVQKLILIVSEILEAPKENYTCSFQDLKCMEKLIRLNDCPRICEIEEQKIVLQEELIRLQQDLEIALENIVKK